MTQLTAKTERAAKAKASRLLGKCGWVKCTPTGIWYEDRINALRCRTATVEVAQVGRMWRATINIKAAQ